MHGLKKQELWHIPKRQFGPYIRWYVTTKSTINVNQRTARSTAERIWAPLSSDTTLFTYFCIFLDVFESVNPSWFRGMIISVSISVIGDVNIWLDWWMRELVLQDVWVTNDRIAGHPCATGSRGGGSNMARRRGITTNIHNTSEYTFYCYQRWCKWNWLCVNEY